MELSKINLLTSSDKYQNDPNYKIIGEVLTKLSRHGVVVMGVGNCISMSDIVRTSLLHRGISSRLVEVSATFTYFHVDPPATKLIGYEGISNPGEIDTHVVVVTNTDPPFLIDSSIMHHLPQTMPVLVEPIDNLKSLDKFLLNTSFDHVNIKITYLQKAKQSVPALFQESIVDRIKTDNKIFKEIEFLKKLNYIGITVSVFALINFVIKFVLYLTGEGGSW